MNNMTDISIHATNNEAILTVGNDSAAAKKLKLTMPTNILKIPYNPIVKHISTVTIKYSAEDSERIVLYTSQLAEFTNMQSLHIERVHLIVDNAKAIAKLYLHHVKLVKCTFEILDPKYSSIVQVFTDHCINILTLTITDYDVGDTNDDMTHTLKLSNEPPIYPVSPV